MGKSTISMGKSPFSMGKSPFSMGKSTISMAIFYGIRWDSPTEAAHVWRHQLRPAARAPAHHHPKGLLVPRRSRWQMVCRVVYVCRITLWWTNILLWKMAIEIEIVDFPIKKGGSFHNYVKLPEGILGRRSSLGWLHKISIMQSAVAECHVYIE